MRKLIFTTLTFLICSISFGQSNVFIGKDSLHIFCDRIMQNFVDGKFSKAVQLFRQHSVLDTFTLNNIDKTINEQMRNVLPVYGKTLGYVLIEEKDLKNTLARRRYLLKFENYFLTFDFMLYNNESGWTVSNFNYKDDPKEMF